MLSILSPSPDVNLLFTLVGNGYGMVLRLPPACHSELGLDKVYPYEPGSSRLCHSTNLSLSQQNPFNKGRL
jgi:hypothetical protein